MSARETCWSQSSRCNVDSAQHAASGRCIVIVQYAIHHFNLAQLRQSSLSRRAREDVGETASADVISGKLLEGGGAPHNVDHAVAADCKVAEGIPTAAPLMFATRVSLIIWPVELNATRLRRSVLCST